MSKKFANQISGRQPRKEALLLLLDSKQFKGRWAGYTGYITHATNAGSCLACWACSTSSDPNKLIGCMT